MEISVRELKTRLSEYLRRVGSGEELIVTSRGKEVARLVPPRSPRRPAPTEEELIARFRSLPWIRPGSGQKPKLPRPVMLIAEGEKTLAEMASEQRG